MFEVILNPLLSPPPPPPLSPPPLIFSLPLHSLPDLTFSLPLHPPPYLLIHQKASCPPGGVRSPGVGDIRVNKQL